MITWSSKGNYRKQPTCGSRRHEGTGSPRSLACLTTHTLTGNAGRDRVLPAWFRADGTEAAPPRRHGEATGDATGTPARLWTSCRPSAQTPPHPKGLNSLWSCSINSREQPQVHTANSSLTPQRQGSTIPFHSRKGRAGRGQHPGSRRLKHPGVPPRTLNWGVLSPDTKYCA